MTEDNNTAQFAQLLLAIGNLQGQAAATTTQLANIHADAVRTAAEIEHKHRENQAAIEDVRKTQTELLNAHTDEDDERFRRVDKYIWMASGALGLLQFIGWLLVFLKN